MTVPAREIVDNEGCHNRLVRLLLGKNKIQMLLQAAASGIHVPAVDGINPVQPYRRGIGLNGPHLISQRGVGNLGNGRVD
ncbi:hypothetical protein D3C75_681540 [compost metagenome]